MIEGARTRIGPRIAAALVILAAAALAFGATRIEYSFSSDPIGPTAFPIALAVALGACGLWYLIRPGGSDDAPGRRALAGVVGFLALGIGSIAAMPWIGFIVAMTVLCAGLARLLAATWPMAFVSAVSQALLWWLLFGPLLGGNLPKGPWGF